MRWVEWLFRKSVRSVINRPTHRRKLKVEPLEDRVVPATVTGTVFTDFNYNGVQNLNPTVSNDSGQGTVGLANEAGVTGLTVTITDSVGATQMTTTGVNGAYSVTLNGTGPYRVTIDTPTGFVSGPTGTNNLGNVRFVAEGNSIVNLGVVRADQYLQANPQIALPRYVFGDQQSATNANTPVLVSFNYSAGSNSTSAHATYDVGVRTTLATASEIGTTWGLAFNENTQTVFASAFFRRHSGFGPDGPGAIYAIDRATGNVTTLVNIPAGADPHTPGDFFTDNTRSVVGGQTVDSGWDSAGKVGWGGLTISDDGSTLYAVNLSDRRLYIIPIANPGAATSVAIPLPTTNGRPDTDARPFAAQFYQGRIYVGVTDTAESTITGADPDGDAAQLAAYVFSFDAANPAGTPQLETQFSLNFARGRANPEGTTANWQPWSRAYRQLNGTGDGNFELAINPMPWLTGIAFDSDGNMALGLRDRLGDVVGAGAFSDPTRPGVPINAIAVGDILRAFGNPVTGWDLESNGTDPLDGTPTGTQNNNLGPGGGEFYDGDKTVSSGGATTPSGFNHDQSAMGAVLQLPGHPDVVTTITDPVPIAGRLFEGGLRWLSNTNGDQTKGYRLYVGRFPASPSSFGKANGLGDLEVLSNPPPSTTVGDRFFFDNDNDGAQDAGELGIAGLTVNLMRGGVIVNTTTTDGNGNYFFTQEGNGTALLPNTNYQICVPLNQAQLANRFITTANALGVATNLNSKIVDDGNGNACINFTTGLVGENNFDLDGGFSPFASVGDFVFNDLNGNGIQETGEGGVAGVAVRLLDNNGAQVGATQTTGTNGLYSFTGLRPGTYSVVFDPTTLPTGTAFSPALQGANTAVDSDANVTTGATAQFTLVAGQNLTTIDAGIQTLASVGDFVFNDLNRNGLQDTGELGVPGVVVRLFDQANNQVGNAVTTNASGLYAFTGLQPGTYSIVFDPTTVPAGTRFTTPLQGANTAIDSDANVATGAVTPFTLVNGQNLTTIDAGIVAIVASVGDLVFNDLNANGIQDAGELGVAGVTVRLFDGNGSQVGSPQVTGADGLYLFSNLLPGTYSVGFDPTTVPTGFGLTRALQGANTAIDSDANPITGRTANFTLVGDQALRTLDAGIIALAALNGSVYVDANNDGVRQNGERGIANVLITLNGTTDIGTTVTISTTTNSNGDYSFVNLRPGIYTVTQPSQPSGFNDGLDAAGSTGGNTGNDIISMVPLVAGVTSVANNFGEISQAPPVIDVQVTQTVSNSTPRIGEVVQFVICVRNNGPAVAQNTIVSTPFPMGLQALSVAAIDQGAFDLSTLNWFIGTLQVGQEVCLTVNVRVNQSGTFTNTAIVSVANQETTLVNNRAPVSLVTPVDPSGVSKQDFLTIPPTNGANNPNLVGTLPLQAPAQAASATSNALVATGTRAGFSPLVQVFDRDTGIERFSFYAFSPFFLGGVNVALGDLNGDGTADIVAAAGPGAGPHVRAFDGVTGQEIRSFFAYDAGYIGGVNLAVADVNGDGVADILTATGNNSAPHVKVFSGATGSELYSFFAYDAAYLGGVNISAGDIDGDNRADIVVGSARGASHVKVFSGATGNELRSFFAYSPQFLGGVTVAAGDVNGDGFADIITGAGPGAGPHIKAFSGSNNGELRSFFADATTFTGGVNVASTDVNADGIDDILSAPASGTSSIVRTFSGLDLTLFDQFLANDAQYTAGTSLAAV
jgi:uncharacterized repeat protein (TIGR01451 family)